MFQGSNSAASEMGQVPHLKFHCYINYRFTNIGGLNPQKDQLIPPRFKLQRWQYRYENFSEQVFVSKEEFWNTNTET